ncbi:NAD-dependent succinate-semialdehyde dehydrogenase [Rhodoglobus sp. NPDC076762]
MIDYAVTDPATGLVVKRYETATDEQIATAVTSVGQAYRQWRLVPIAERAAMLRKVADRYASDRERLAEIIIREMGKTTAEALGEVDLCVSIYAFYADNAEAFAADKPIDVASGSAYVRSEPIGALLGIMPWNYPYYQVARFAAPNLALGNTMLLKHAPSCPESAEAIAEIFADAGFPEGVYVNIFATNEQVETIIESPVIQGVSLTGSERAGRAVGAIAGREMKKLVLELGGSDPFIVLDDADLDAAIAGAVAGRMGNAGQACNNSKRIIVLDAIYDRFVEGFVAQVQALKVGEPREGGLAFGPLSSEAAAAQVVGQVEDAVANGATLLTGGGRIDRPGAYVEPTVIADVQPGTRAYTEEIFGPVAAVYRVADQDAAIRLANDSPYGLGSVIFTSDDARAQAVAEQLEVGMVAINAPSQTQADLPFGGVKSSGMGRELGEYGMAEFVNRKLIRRA